MARVLGDVVRTSAAGREVVSKRQGERYARARATEWGDRLPGR